MRILDSIRTLCGKSQRPSAPDSGSDGRNSFPDVNLGSPVRFDLPCHEGLSCDAGNNVWSEGERTVIRAKIRGAYRRGLCFSLDYATYQGSQSADVYVNDAPVGRIDGSARATCVFPIPASCVGEARELTVRFEIHGAVSPAEVVNNGDGRRLALRFFDMRFYDEDGYFAYRRGEDLFFGLENGAVAAQYCLKGISSPERPYAWTDGEKTVMRFCPFEFDGSPRSLTLHYRTFLDKEHVGIAVNGVGIADYIATGEETKTVEIPASCASADGYMTVELLLPDAASPKELQMGADGRKLALSLFSVRLD